MRYIIRLSYDGSAFCGWQIQNNAKTVQGELEKSASTIIGHPVHMTGAGRTDTDVNAMNYIAHFDLPDDIIFDAAHICYKLNAITPKEIVIHEISVTDPDFHARFGARSREYQYFIHFRKDPFCEKFSYRMRQPLDIDKMNEAAAYLLGEHDFSCFEKTGGNNATSVCTIYEAGWKHYSPWHADICGDAVSDQDYIVFRIRADRFLRNMVRAIVGSLIEVGRGKREPEWIDALIRSRDRSEAGSSVPGNALFFCGATYK